MEYLILKKKKKTAKSKSKKKFKLESPFVLDAHSELGEQEPLHTLLNDYARENEMNQSTYATIRRSEIAYFAKEEIEEDREPGILLEKIFKEVDRLTGKKHKEFLLLYWW